MTPDYHDETHARRHDHEREVIVTNGSGTNWAGAVAGILAIIVFGILGYLFLVSTDAGSGGATEVPGEVDVNLEDGGEAGTEG